ncbi:DUF885 domain-containing protein [Alteromonas facilis]|uniref:DUF885 domain-containing protein n=1 Tax=Alteromonas facilis TaxID=2048004 RepID=UPI000C286BF2|nr:DUF885 domain-containing protein [Alteromonas facilis]
MYRSFITIILILITASTVASEPTNSGTQSKELSKWFEQKYQEYLQFSPITLTRLGLKERYSEIDDMSEKAEHQRLNWYISAAKELQQRFIYENLSTEEQTSFDVFMLQAERAQLSYQYRYNRYIFHQMEGIHVRLPNFLINSHKVETVDDMHAYIRRIGELSRAISQLLIRAKQNAEKGVRPPRFSYDEVIQHCQNLISGYPFNTTDSDAPLYADAKQEIQALLDNGLITQDIANDLQKELIKVLKQKFLPAYQNVLEWMQADIVNTSDIAHGVSTLPDGDNYYAATLKIQNTTDMTADDIHELGLKQITRIRKDMLNIMEKVGFKGSLQDFFKLVRDNKDDRRFFYPDTDDGREAYLQDSRDYLASLTTLLPNYFGILPKADLVVRRVEPFREQPGMAQHYYAGTPDGSRPGTYYAHLSDMTAMPIIEMEAVAYHEGNPGHHMQISIAQELENVPSFRTQASFTGFVEGWAVYSELLAKEMGAFEDPYSDFGRLVLEIWRAIRLVADTGINAKGWTEEQAFEFFKQNSPRSDVSMRTEVRRYFVWPGQATAYMIGRLKILELRDRAQEKLGDKFDIRTFHDEVIGGGSLPLSILEKRIDNWIAKQLQDA